MPHYLISYDLRKQRNYQPLYDALNQWKAAKLLESLWLAELVGPATTIRDILSSCIDTDDGLVIIELRPSMDWATLRSEDSGGRRLKIISP